MLDQRFLDLFRYTMAELNFSQPLPTFLAPTWSILQANSTIFLSCTFFLRISFYFALQVSVCFAWVTHLLYICACI